MAESSHRAALEEKLSFLQEEEVTASDPDQKFHLRKRIEEIQKKLERISAEDGDVPRDNRGNVTTGMRSKARIVIVATAATLTLAVAGLLTLIGISNDTSHSVRIHPTAFLADLAYHDYQKGHPLRMEIAINGRLIGQVDPYLGQITILGDHALSEERSNSWDDSYREFFEDPTTGPIIIGNIYDYEYFSPPKRIHHGDELHINLLHRDDITPHSSKTETLSFMGQIECQEVELDARM